MSFVLSVDGMPYSDLDRILIYMRQKETESRKEEIKQNGDKDSLSELAVEVGPVDWAVCVCHLPTHTGCDTGAGLESNTS